MGWGGVDMGAAGARAAAKAERELNMLMFDVAGRVAAIATAQRAWLVSAPPLQEALHMFLDVVAPDADDTLARYSRARIRFDAFRGEVAAAEERNEPVRLAPCSLLLAPCHLLLGTCCLLLAACCLLLAACSLLFAPCSLLLLLHLASATPHCPAICCLPLICAPIAVPLIRR